MDKRKELLNNKEPELEDLGNSQPIHITENKTSWKEHQCGWTTVSKSYKFGTSQLSQQKLWQIGLTMIHMGQTEGIL